VARLLALVPDIRSCSKQGIKQQFGEVLGGGYKPGASDGNIRCSLFFGATVFAGNAYL